MIDWASYVRSIYGLFPGGNKDTVSGCFRCYSDNHLLWARQFANYFWLILIDKYANFALAQALFWMAGVQFCSVYFHVSTAYQKSNNLHIFICRYIWKYTDLIKFLTSKHIFFWCTKVRSKKNFKNEYN